MLPDGWTVTLILEHLEEDALDSATSTLIELLEEERLLGMDARYEPPS